VHVARVKEPLAVLVSLVGIVFVGQGLGIIRNRSIMVGDITWAWIGAAMVLVAAAVLIRGRWSRR
jgi:hypothetical protein